jgi:hypothetical protein
MKKLTTAATNGIAKLQRLTIGLDLGDRSSHYCVLDEMGRMLAERKVSTSPNAMKEVFGSMPRSRISCQPVLPPVWRQRRLRSLAFNCDECAKHKLLKQRVWMQVGGPPWS